MRSIVTTFRGADIKVEVANFCAAMDTLINQDGWCKASSKASGLLPAPQSEHVSAIAFFANFSSTMTFKANSA